MKLIKILLEADQSKEDFKPYIVKDPNNPNFLQVIIKYPEGSGTLTALGQRTMSGQDRDSGAQKAMKIGQAVASELESKYNLEDIDVTDQGNGKVVVFAVSDDFAKVDELNAKQLFTAAGIGLATLAAPNMGKAQQKEPTPISQTTQQKDTTMTGFGIGKSSEHRIAKQMARMKATADLMQKMKVQTLKGGIEIKSEKTFQTSNGYEVEMTVAVSQ
jgi:hypothetical protein